MSLTVAHAAEVMHFPVAMHSAQLHQEEGTGQHGSYRVQVNFGEGIAGTVAQTGACCIRLLRVEELAGSQIATCR